jgi:hypothetical protein
VDFKGHHEGIVMRIVLGFLLIVFAGGCKDAGSGNPGHGIPQDTVFDGDFTAREKLELKRPTIQLDNGIGGSPAFTVGDTSILRIRIPGLTKYEMHARQAIGASIVKLDSARGLFLVIPRNNEFSFVLDQYYPVGQVIRYTRNWNEAKSVYDERIVALDGMTEISKLDFKAR